MDERKRRIMEHLARSSGNPELGQQISVPQITVQTSPRIEMDDRKKRIMEHLNRSAGKFGMIGDSEQRKRQIIDHIRRTTS
jgi:hypothetical protein